MQTTDIAQASSGALTAPRGLSGTALKFLALGLMVLDHIHYFFGFTGAVPLLFTQLGRLASPLFLFCTVEGFAHTRNRRAYFLRMVAIGAPMGALQFFMAYAGVLRRPDGFYPQNGVFLNFILLCIIWQGMDWLRARRFVRGALAVFLPMVWPFLASVLSLQFPALMNPIGLLCYSLLPSWGFIIDGGLFYILQGIAMYALRRHRAAQIGAFVVTELLFYLVLPLSMLWGEGFEVSMLFTMAYEWLGVFAVIPMALYNGRRGSGHKKLFYLFYPAHVYLLYAASWGVYLILNR